MILSDLSILERMEYEASNPRRISIDPFAISSLQGASVDLHLGLRIIYRGPRPPREYRDLYPEYLDEHTITLKELGQWLLPPHGVCLAATNEYITTPSDCVARVEGKSSLGRQFVIIHCTAGWCDPGFRGNITLEIVNHDPVNSFLLEAFMPICQLTYLQLDREAERQYKGKYQGDLGPVEAR